MGNSTRRTFLAGSGSALFAAIASQKASAQSGLESRSIEIRTDVPVGIIQPELHGQFAEHLGSCIYGGLWVGRNSRIPNINGYRKAGDASI